MTRPASLSLLNPVPALGSLLSVALSSVTAKSNYMIPFVFISCQCTTTPTRVYSFERRRCSVYSDDTVQLKTAQVFNNTAIFNCRYCTLLHTLRVPHYSFAGSQRFRCILFSSYRPPSFVYSRLMIVWSFPQFFPRYYDLC